MENENEIDANQKESVKSILSQVWRVQYRAVGDESVDKLYDAVQSQQSLDDLLSSPEGGSSLDITSAWQLLYQAVGLTVNVIALYKIFKQEHNRPPSEKELLKKVEDAGILSYYPGNVRKKKVS